LDDSIEIPRGGNEKKTGRGKGKKITKPSKTDSLEETMDPPEDTREIPRSTTHVNLQLTMERMRRTVPQQKLTKDSAKGEDTSLCFIFFPGKQFYFNLLSPL
jgi:hypothetical protein